MQRRKNVTLLISLVLMIILTGFLFWYGGEDHSVSIDKSLFRVTDYKTINQVTLESPTSKVDLKFNGSKWKINDQFDADRDMIDVLFATMQQAQPKIAVASAQRDSIGNSLEQDGVKITLYAGDQVEKSFYAGGNPQKTIAYFKLPQHEPYVMVIPGYRVYASGVFELTQAGWRDKFVFGFNWRNFQELVASFPGRPEDDFRIALSNGSYGVEGIAQTDTANLNTFLDKVSLLTVDQYVEKGAMADSLSLLQPLMTIRVKDIAKREYSLSIFSIPEMEKQNIGLVGTSQPALFDPKKIAPLLKTRKFFTRK